MPGAGSEGWLRRHRQASVYFLTAVALVATVAAATLGGFRLHHAVLIERQTLRTDRLAQEALELQDAAVAHAPRAALARSLADTKAAFTDLELRNPSEAERIRLSYAAFVTAVAHGVAAETIRELRAGLESRLRTEVDAQAAATHRVNPSARAALVAAAVFAGLLVALLIWQFELERRSGRIDRDNAVRAEELARLREEFVAVVSHELRTPLTSIVGYLELLSDDGADALTEEQRSYLGVVLRSSQRLSELVGDLLLVAEGERAPLTLELGGVDLATLVDQAVEAAGPAAVARRIELHAQHDGAPTLRGDRTRLAQMLDNLVSNALKFTPDGGRVVVRVGTESDAAVIEVSDTGCGITADDRVRIFEPFFRARDAVRQAVPGTGLGLTIVKAIVEAHGGSIEVAETAHHAGATFRVRLPAL